MLCNTGALPVEITSAVLSGSPEFTLVTNLTSQYIQAGECIPVEFTFSPGSVEHATCSLTLKGTCISDITLTVNANGVCTAKAIDTVNIGTEFVNTPKDSITVCIFKNTNSDPITIHPVVEGSSDFTIDITETKILNPGECLSITITFKPSALGKIFAKISYQLDAACNQLYTYLVGEGVSSVFRCNEL